MKQHRTPPPIFAPNFTQIPNVILDNLDGLGEAQIRIILAVARKTFGWHKSQDRISLSQFQKMTGLSRLGARQGIDQSLVDGWLIRYPRGQSFVYELLVNDPTVQPSDTVPGNLVAQSDQTAAPTVQPSNTVPGNLVAQLGPKPGNLVAPQKKDSNIKRKESNNAAPKNGAASAPAGAGAGTRAIQDAYVIALGYSVEDWAAGESKAAKAIGEKYTVPQFNSAYAYYKAMTFWQDQRLSLRKMASLMPEYLRLSPAQRANGNGRHNGSGSKQWANGQRPSTNGSGSTAGPIGGDDRPLSPAQRIARELDRQG